MTILPMVLRNWSAPIRRGPVPQYHLFHARIYQGTFCPARIRNLGAQHSSGTALVFLDCGVLVPLTFAMQVAVHCLESSQQVLVHYTAGLSAPLAIYTQQVAEDMSPSTLLHTIQHLLQDAAWIDPREGIFDLTGDQLDLLPAPWLLTWTCALTVPRRLFEQVGGFDEAFQHWGGEDTDFAFRLYQAGVSFRATKEYIAFHIPHEKLPLTERLITNKENRRKTHRKVYTFETELHLYYSGIDYTQIFYHYHYLVLMNATPPYSAEMLDILKTAYIPTEGNSLLVGADSKLIAESLPTTHNFVHRRSAWQQFSQWFPAREVRYLLGCDTPYVDGFFSTIIVTDFVRLLPALMRNDLLQELYRIGHVIYYLHTANYTSFALEMNRMAAYEEIVQTLAAVHLRLELVLEIEDTVLFQVSA